MDWKPIARIGAGLAMTAAIAWAPLWLGAVLVLAFAWLFAPYYELLLWGIAYGALYGLHDWRGVPIAFAVLVIVEALRTRFRAA